MWYVIWVTAGKEDTSINQIEKYCNNSTFYRVVSPKRKIMKRIQGKWVSILERFITSYIFVESDTIDEFADELSHIEGFSNVLKNDGFYMPLQPKEEILLNRMIGDDDIIEESKGIAEGHDVRIIDGPLVGLEGMIKYVNRHKRLAVLEIELFDRTTEVQLGLEIIERVE